MSPCHSRLPGSILPASPETETANGYRRYIFPPRGVKILRIILFHLWVFIPPPPFFIFGLHLEASYCPLMKAAVFQVSEAGGAARLICLEMSSLQSAGNLEHWLQMNAPVGTEVRLIGRFESVTFVATEEEAESCVLSHGQKTQDCSNSIVHDSQSPP